MNHDFYRAFEEHFRGSRDLIKMRLKVYLPYARLLTEICPGGQYLDLGCGRGEWLELLRDEGCSAYGVDLDESMLAACRDLGLNVQTLDALSALGAQADSSIALISGFHIAEHLSFDELQTLFKEAIRVLKPGGILILETPNPDNLIVATANFYLDPTHNRPIPKQMLSFMATHYGFGAQKILGVNHEVNTETENFPSIYAVLASASPDYSLLAQKHKDSETFQKFEDVPHDSKGITLAEIADRYEKRMARTYEAVATIEKIKATRLWRIMEKLK